MPSQYLLAGVAVAVAAVTAVTLTSRQIGSELPASPYRHADMDRNEPASHYMLAQRLFNSTPNEKAFDAATRAALALRSAGKDGLTRAAVPSWQFEGPVEIGGRILEIALDPSNDDIIYIATATGGVWKSVDQGDVFTSVWPDENMQAIGSITMASDGTLYAGTGEAAPGALTYGAGGLFKSTDGGASWSSLGLEPTRRIGRVALDPSDESRIFVAALGALYTPGPDRGVYRSEDAGATWDLVLPGTSGLTGASDVQIDPTNPNRIYAVMWEHQYSSEVAPSIEGGPGSGIFRSDDGGDSWTRLAGGLPAESDNAGRIGIAMAPSNTQRLYAIYSDFDGFFDAFYTSIDGGDSWVALPNNAILSGSQSSFAWWFARLWVDPAVETRVWVAGVSLVESLDGGLSWAPHTGIHADQHAMAWDADIAGRVYLGNDGGFYTSSQNAITGSWVAASVQPYTQYFTVDVGEQDPSRIVAGAQDNGCNRSYPGSWNRFGCGDGLEVLINPQDQDIVYGCSQRGSCSRSTNGGNSNASIGSTTSQRRNWKTPLVFDPTDPSVMYYAGNIVNRSTNGGISWTTISTELTHPLQPGENTRFRTVTAVTPAKTDPNVIYVGTDDARVWYTRDLGATWTESTDPILPQRWVSDVVVDTTDADIAYLSYSGFRVGDEAAYVFRTADGGVSWSDITSNLPQAPVTTLEITADGVLLVGNDVGTYISHDDGATWQSLGTGIPLVPITDFRMHGPSRTLYASTFGRGVYSVAVPLRDTDLDGLPDVDDNCTLVVNPSQCDTDGDNYGNHCDADLNNDDIVNSFDLSEMRTNFGASGVNVADLDCNNIVNSFDLARLRGAFGGKPGPSGLIP